jgi:hypothetical protein
MSNALNSALYSKLSGGTALTALVGTIPNGTAPAIFSLNAPKDQPLPYVVYSWQGGGLTPDHDIVSGVEWVRAYGTSAAQAGSIYAQLDALLNGGSLSVSGYTNIGLRREDEIERVDELPNTEPVYTCGAIYRIILDQ